jgi:hypothetical protein
MTEGTMHSFVPKPPDRRPFLSSVAAGWILLALMIASACVVVGGFAALGWFARGWVGVCL